MKLIIALFLFALLQSCSTSTKTNPENIADVVISRIDELSARPDWVSESEPFKVKNGIVYSLGSTVIPGDHRIEAAYRIAENNAKALIVNSIQQRLEFVFQNAEEGTAIDSTQARYLGAEASSIISSSMQQSKRYWEKVATTRDNGDRVTQFRVFSLVTMPEPEFKKAIIDSLRKQQGKAGLSAEFAKKVDAQWDKFTEARTPSND